MLIVRELCERIMGLVCQMYSVNVLSFFLILITIAWNLKKKKTSEQKNTSFLSYFVEKFENKKISIVKKLCYPCICNICPCCTVSA
jgi:hypothetical protein